jgi:hypothetical protein
MKEGYEGEKALTGIKTRKNSPDVGVQGVVLFKYIICLSEVYFYQPLS